LFLNYKFLFFFTCIIFVFQILDTRSRITRKLLWSFYYLWSHGTRKIYVLYGYRDRRSVREIRARFFCSKNSPDTKSPLFRGQKNHALILGTPCTWLILQRDPVSVGVGIRSSCFWTFDLYERSQKKIGGTSVAIYIIINISKSSFFFISFDLFTLDQEKIQGIPYLERSRQKNPQLDKPLKTRRIVVLGKQWKKKRGIKEIWKKLRKLGCEFV